MSFDDNGNLTAAGKKIVSVHHVAAYILEQTGEISVWRLQRLTYYSQAWKLAWYEYPMFRARAEAWGAGPTIPELYRLHKGKFTIGSWEHGDASQITKTNKEVIDCVLESYGALDNIQFGEIARSEQPWKDANNKYSFVRRGEDTIISQEDMLIAYSALAVSEDAVDIGDLQFDNQKF